MTVQRGFAALAAAVACVGLVFGGAAQATTLVTATYTGTISELLDPNGLVGAPTSVLTASNLAFTDVFKFDADVGLRSTSASDDNLLGGSSFGGASPLISSVLTINGVVFNFDGQSVQQQYAQQGVQIDSAAWTFGPAGDWALNSISIETNAPGLITTPYTGTAHSHVFFDGQALICTNNGANCSFQAWFNPETVKVTVGGGAPEPATWAMLLAGFGGLGCVLRRRRAAMAVFGA